MTKTKLAFVRCRLSCFSRRPVRFFPVFSLLPVRCCSPVVVFAVRHWDLPAFSRGGFFAIVFLFFYRLFLPVVRFAFFPSFSFCLSVVVRLSSFSLSGIGTCRLFPAADFSLSSFCFFIVFSLPPSGLLFSPSFPFCRYFPSLFVFSFVAFCIWSFFSAFLFSFFSVLFFLFYREATSGRKTGGHGRRMALKLFLPMARQKETPPKRGNFYK